MGFLKKLFGGGNKDQEYMDTQGIYLYARSKRGAVVKVRADKKHDLNRSDSGGYVWHKTLVDNKYFTRMEAVVHFDGNYNITQSRLTNGEFITQEEYAAALQAEQNPPSSDEPEDEIPDEA